VDCIKKTTASKSACYSYALFEVEPKDLQKFFSENNFHGINVTIPYKQAVMDFCDELSPAAKKIGSVNTIVRVDGKLFGDNTDAAGFKKMVDALGVSVKNKKVIIFGSGGSSLSVSYVMNELGAAEIVVVAIEDNRADFLARHADAKILVNCTPVGMYPLVDASPVSLENFPQLEGVLDVVYNPARTRLLQDAETRGIANIGGLTMLVGQAAAASKIFTGIDVRNEKKVINKLRRDMENIILIGMPGSGKTTHGTLLAQKLNKTFIDTDEEIIKADGRSIPEIFAQDGEEIFRQKETAAIAKFGKESGLVIATGGGCVTREVNFHHLHQNGIIIFTEKNIETLATEGRPLSQGGLSDMYKKRLPMYNKFADIIVCANDTPEVVTNKILEAYHEIYCN
jgi:shikimate dehydrogenase